MNIFYETNIQTPELWPPGCEFCLQRKPNPVRGSDRLDWAKEKSHWRDKLASGTNLTSSVKQVPVTWQCILSLKMLHLEVRPLSSSHQAHWINTVFLSEPKDSYLPCNAFPQHPGMPPPFCKTAPQIILLHRVPGNTVPLGPREMHCNQIHWRMQHSTLPRRMLCYWNLTAVF